MERPKLNTRPIPTREEVKGEVVITLREKQWDENLQAAYDNNCILIELDFNYNPIKAFQRNYT